MKVKAGRVEAAAAKKYNGKVPNKVTGVVRKGRVIQVDGDPVEPDTPAPKPPPQGTQYKQQGQAQQAVGTGQAPVRQPARPQPQPQAPAAGPNTQIRHRGYTWTPFINGTAARKYYGGNVIGTKINGQAYYRPFNAEGSTSTGSYARSTRNVSRPGKRVVVPAYRRVL